MKKALLILILIHNASLLPMGWGWVPDWLKRRPHEYAKISLLDTLPADIRAQIISYITGDTLGESVKNIKRFYVASPASRSSVIVNQAILKYLMLKFDYEFKNGNKLQEVVKNLNAFPVFKNPEMLAWIEQEKKRLDDEETLREAAGPAGNIQKVQELINQKIDVNARV